MEVAIPDLNLIKQAEQGAGRSDTCSVPSRMNPLQESVRRMRAAAPAQIPGAKISVCHGVGGMFAASGTIIMSNEAP